MSFGKNAQPPSAPNPALAIAAQSAANSDAIRESAKISSIDQFSPFGSLTYQRDSEGVPTAQISSLTPGSQEFLNTTEDIGNTLGNTAMDLSQFLPNSNFNLDGIQTVSPNELSFNGGLNINPTITAGNNYGGDISAVEQATFDRTKGLIDPEFAISRDQLEQRLADRGIPVGSEAYTKELDRFDRNKGETYSRLASDAVLAGRQEQGRLFGQDLTQQGTSFAQNLQSRQQSTADQLSNINLQDSARSRQINERLLTRSQPFNEIAALLQGAPAINAQQYAPPPQYNVAPPNVIDAQFGSANLANQQFNQQQQLSAANLGGLYGLAGTLGAGYLSGR